MRYTRLDGLRGLLSVIVALNHSFLILAIPASANIWGANIFIFHGLQSKLQQIFMLLGNGGLAVTIFFVLSGFVLGESFGKGRHTIKNSAVFLIRRLLRLYPVYLILVIVSALYMWSGFRYQTYQAASPWFHWWMNFEMSFKELLLNAFFIHIYLGGVTWTLRVIIIASLLFPLMYIIFKKASLLINFGLIVLLTIASFTIFDLHRFIDLRYLYMFYLGLTIPRSKHFFVSLQPALHAITLIPFVFIAFYLRFITDIYQAMVFESLFAWLLIGLIVYNSTRIFLFLESRLFQFLGRISYSLYLTHFTVLYIFSKIVLDIIPAAILAQNYFLAHGLIFLVTLALTIPVSLLVHRFIESPAQSISRAVKIG